MIILKVNCPINDESTLRHAGCFFYGSDGVWTSEFVALEADTERLVRELHESGLFEVAPYWTRFTELLVKDKAEGYTTGGYRATDIRVSQMGTDFTVTAPDGSSESYQMKLIGAHNVINVVGAIAVANKLGVKHKDLKVPVRRLQRVEHRMQLREHGLVTIIDDAYNSNPVGSRAAVETLKLFDGIRILITPGMVELGDKEEEYNFKFGTYAAACCDHILLVGKKRTKPIYDGALSKGFPEDKIKAYDKLEEALAHAYEIKGRGHKYILLENDLPDNY